MRHIAFVLDPDGYWGEIIGQKPVETTEGVKETDVETYRMVRGLDRFSGMVGDAYTFSRGRTTP